MRTMWRQFIHFEGLEEDTCGDLEGSEVDDEDNAEAEGEELGDSWCAAAST